MLRSYHCPPSPPQASLRQPQRHSPLSLPPSNLKSRFKLRPYLSRTNNLNHVNIFQNYTFEVCGLPEFCLKIENALSNRLLETRRPNRRPLTTFNTSPTTRNRNHGIESVQQTLGDWLDGIIVQLRSELEEILNRKHAGLSEKVLFQTHFIR
jgi:hypothetical protein